MSTLFKAIGGGLKLTGSLLWALPQLLLVRRKAAAAFRKEMRKQGLDQSVIDELTGAYLEMGDLNRWINEN